MVVTFIIVNPSVNAIFMEHVAAVPKLSDVVTFIQPTQADCTRVRNPRHPFLGNFEGCQHQTLLSFVKKLKKKNKSCLGSQMKK